MTYCLDTSAILDGWARYYPPENFPSFWTQLDALIARGDAFACRQVLEELGARDDGARDWLAQHGSAVVEIDEERFELAQAINGEFPGWADRKRSGADPFVVALGEMRGWKVITGERLAGTLNPRKTKIPDVCQHRGVDCGAIIDLIREQGWRF